MFEIVYPVFLMVTLKPVAIQFFDDEMRESEGSEFYAFLNDPWRP
jgi:hypothetical protein